MTLEMFKYLVAISAALLVVQSIRAISTYGAVASLTEGPRRQLPLHVTAIAASYLIYLLATTGFLLTVTAPNHAVEVLRASIFGANTLLGHYALYNVLSYDRRKLSRLTNFEDVDDSTE